MSLAVERLDAEKLWGRALSLRERLSRLKPLADDAVPTYRYQGLGLGLWSGTAYRHRLTLAERLDREQIDAHAFRRVIAGGSDWDGAHVPWRVSYERLTESTPEATVLQSASGPTRAALIEAFAGPEIQHALASVRQQLATSTLGAIVDVSRVPELMVPQLIRGLAGLALRTLVREMHVARLRGQLDGPTPQERFACYVRLCAQPQYRRELLDEYPVLARDIHRCTEGWITNVAEFVTRMCADASQIRTLIGVGEAVPLTVHQIQAGAGDAHRGGRTVVVVDFGKAGIVVYKPRPMGVERSVRVLTSWLNEDCGEELWRTADVVDRGNYGWAEGIRRGPCESVDGIRRFYRRQGAALALFYALDATDMHLENVIASGEFPVWVDLEALFQPELKPDPDMRAIPQGQEAFTGSVLRVGLLPHRVWRQGQAEPLDVSGLGGAPGQKTPHRVLVTTAEGTDEMRFVRDYFEIPGALNRPTFAGQDVDASAHVDAVVDGFEAGYRAIWRLRQRLAASDGLPALFAAAPVRVVFRATRTYHELLQEAAHPDVLRDGLARDELFDYLWTGLLPAHVLDRIVAHEQLDLSGGDIPMFTTTPASSNVVTSGGVVLSGLLLRPMLEKVTQRISTFSDADLAQQVWYIRAAFATTTREGALSALPIRPRADLAHRHRALGLDLARRIGDRLAALAHVHGADVYWSGLSLIANKYWQLVPTSPSLYDGCSGIGLFLAYLAECSGTDRFRTLAESAVDTADREWQRRLEARVDEFCGIGGFSGLGGHVFALTHVSALWRSEKHTARAAHWVRVADGRIAADREFDVIGGAAGLLLALLAYYEATGDEFALESARRCGDHLRDYARAAGPGVGWGTQIDATGPLGGFAHGCSGIALALDRLAAAIGHPEYYDLASQARRYEDTLFEAATNNWRDLRSFEGEGNGASLPSHSIAAWCHGAPGIGLARLHSQRAGGRIDPRSIAAAAMGAVALGFGTNHSLCHGDLGNLEFLREAAGESMLALATVAEAMQEHVLCEIDAHGPQCGIPLAVETPGLMTGLSGIGFGLLRVAAPASVPSVLTLAGPKASS